MTEILDSNLITLDSGLIRLTDSAFAIGQHVLPEHFRESLLLPSSAVISESLHSHDLSGRHSHIQPPLHLIRTSLQTYLDAITHDPTHTSAIFALPRFYRKKSWHKLTRGVFHLVAFGSSGLTLSDHAVVKDEISDLQLPPWSFELWSDPPGRPMCLNVTRTESDSELMISKCQVGSRSADVLVDQGATHSFMDNSFAKPPKLPLTATSSSVTLWRQYICYFSWHQLCSDCHWHLHGES